ncbi:hypothetical protein LTR66_016245 [Elasticomyces elasticus]|nr:hypothetical protein LTR66_016245 [Elasticomyces elasticus]
MVGSTTSTMYTLRWSISSWVISRNAFKDGYPPAEVKSITYQVAEALDFMHTKGITHRDLKPANIFVATGPPNWWTKVADFGVSKRVRGETTALHTSLEGDFMAPEILGFVDDETDGQYTERVDLWSLGCLTYWLMCERIPILRQKLLGFCTRPWVKAKTLIMMDDIDEDAAAFMLLLLRPQPLDRLTAQDVLDHEWPEMPKETNDESSAITPTISRNNSTSKKILDVRRSPEQRGARHIAENLDPQKSVSDPNPITSARGGTESVEGGGGAKYRGVYLHAHQDSTRLFRFNGGEVDPLINRKSATELVDYPEYHPGDEMLPEYVALAKPPHMMTRDELVAMDTSKEIVQDIMASTWDTRFLGRVAKSTKGNLEVFYAMFTRETKRYIPLSSFLEIPHVPLTEAQREWYTLPGYVRNSVLSTLEMPIPNKSLKAVIDKGLDRDWHPNGTYLLAAYDSEWIDGKQLELVVNKRLVSVTKVSENVIKAKRSLFDKLKDKFDSSQS